MQAGFKLRQQRQRLDAFVRYDQRALKPRAVKCSAACLLTRGPKWIGVGKLNFEIVMKRGFVTMSYENSGLM